MYYDEDPFVEKIKGCADFPIDVETEFDNEVLFDIVFKEKVKPEEVDKVTKALERFFIKYNRWHFKPIHYVSSMWEDAPEQINVFTVRIHIDFGGAMAGAYIGAVKAIANSGADIYRLILN